MNKVILNASLLEKRESNDDVDMNWLAMRSQTHVLLID